MSTAKLNFLRNWKLPNATHLFTLDYSILSSLTLSHAHRGALQVTGGKVTVLGGKAKKENIREQATEKMKKKRRGTKILTSRERD